MYPPPAPAPAPASPPPPPPPTAPPLQPPPPAGEEPLRMAPLLPQGRAASAAYRPSPWSSGLCDCFDDVGNCCITCLCPCVTFGQIAEIVDGGSSSCGGSGAMYWAILCVTGWACLFSCFYRSKLRGQFFLEEAPCSDCLVHCCCESCALCQEYRELTHRGFHVPMGWKANMDRMARGVNAPPAIVGGMTR
ncbi:unnamed protein product [Spirodela intermedia]|uniref:Uncharacterized protein n=1 Tax=Spirodela intermedia TaxID=51605 RepID=A0A7I8IPI5_SPIIN|nr:unnamed protein product [Spirodela intermedia]CAA6658920.1 unnamed protein product [Spirodela intermedia]